MKVLHAFPKANVPSSFNFIHVLSKKVLLKLTILNLFIIRSFMYCGLWDFMFCMNCKKEFYVHVFRIVFNKCKVLFFLVKIIY